MPSRRSEVFVTEFLRDALGVGALGVPKLEARARAEGLLGERQRISTAKPFRKAKSALGHTVDPGRIWTRRGVALEIATIVKPRRLRRLNASQFAPSGAFHSIGSRGSSAFSITVR